ncbi:hypothetical protein [Planktothrix tepida]|uniref:hypothetical protein n=1 Tax=Planktothrix tepida TaxID=1678309 RepID=UPI0016489716|nr:hypothetical protein [Planktothrix tepida]
MNDSVQNHKAISKHQGRKSKWGSPTKAIRVPEKYADRLIELARQWESEDPGRNS